MHPFETLSPLTSPPAPTRTRATSRHRLLAGGLLAGLATSGTLFPLADHSSARATTASERHATSILATSWVAPAVLPPVARPAQRASRGAVRTGIPTKGNTSRFVSTGRSFTGLASWYGAQFDGRRTASGERFDADAMTAASRTLPFGTRLRVCRSSRCVVVRINDRGPFVSGRVLDLSRAARQELGFSGVARVTATPVGVRAASRTRPALHRAAPARRGVPVRPVRATPAPLTAEMAVVAEVAPPTLLTVTLLGSAGTGMTRGRRMRF